MESFCVKFEITKFHFPNSIWSKILFILCCHEQLKLIFSNSAKRQIEKFFNVASYRTKTISGYNNKHFSL